MFLTHIDENGMDSPPVLIPNSKEANRAVNIPEFVNIAYDDLHTIALPAVDHFKHLLFSQEYLKKGRLKEAVQEIHAAMKVVPDDNKFIAEALVMLGWLTENREQGIKFMQRAVKKDPEFYGAHFDLGVLYLLMGKEKDALASLKNSLDVIPDAPLTLGKMAEIHAFSKDAKLKNLKKALQLAQRANKLTYYRQDVLLTTLGRILSEAGREG